MTDLSMYVQARSTYHTTVGGEQYTVDRGELVHRDHPLVAQNPEQFVPVELDVRYDVVEQATAAPGEKRNTGRRRPAPNEENT
jgi:hypothetical protein